MCFEELKKKASALPMAPGVYIMKDKSGAVIYVGKAKKLWVPYFNGRFWNRIFFSDDVKIRTN